MVKVNMWTAVPLALKTETISFYEMGNNSIELDSWAKVAAELEKLVGLKKLKLLIQEIYALKQIQQRRKEQNLRTEPQMLHMIFKGNPGTGKTTAARMIGKALKTLGILQKGQLWEVERADLVGEYIGHTAQKTREWLKKANGGIIFIDEAYSLARGGEKDFGKEAIDALVKGIEDYKDSLIVILAGYREEMDCFLAMNPGLRSRFPLQIDFPDYTLEELLEIAHLILKKKDYQLNLSAWEALRQLIRQNMRAHQHIGNARMVRNLLEEAIRRQALRLWPIAARLDREDLMLIQKEDLDCS